MVKKVCARTFIGAVLAFLYLPIIWITVFSFTESTTFGDWNGFSFQPYIDLFAGPRSDRIFAALGNTMLIAVCAGLLSTVLGTLAVLGLSSMKKKKLKGMYNSLSKVPMINADIVTAVSLMLLFTLFRTVFNIQGDTSLLNVILAHTTFCVPYVMLNITPHMKIMDKSLYEAALDLGATPSQAITKVVLPELMPGISMGFVMAVTLSIDDFVVSYFNIENLETLSTYIYTVNAGKVPLPPDIRALSSLMFLLILGLLLFVNIKGAKNKQKAKHAKRVKA